MLDFDYVLVGGGLQSGLIALALRARRPGVRIALVEREDRLGGNHTWCFHGTDVPEGAGDWLEPLVCFRWPGYRVLFPEREQSLDVEYAGVSSDRLHRIVSAAIREHDGSELRLGTEATSLHSDRVVLKSGDELRGEVVIDARGPDRSGRTRSAGFQKFLGLEAILERPHGLDRPILMDATVDQSRGFRFFYVLPFDERTVLVEDTYFHDTPLLQKERIRGEVRSYMDARGWTVASIRREESGVLPMPWADDVPAEGVGSDDAGPGVSGSRVSGTRGSAAGGSGSGGSGFGGKGPLLAGYRGGWFHPGTGYSFPVALRLADFIASRPADRLFGPELADFSRRHRRQATFARFLNRLLFRWYPPPARRHVFERFYRLPDATVKNWYALRLRWRDALRMVVGRPPRGLSLRHRLDSASA